MTIHFIHPSHIDKDSITAEHDNAGRPVSNALDTHPQKPFISSESNDIVGFSVSGGSSALYLYSSNISTLTISIWQGGATDKPASGSNDFIMEEEVFDMKERATTILSLIRGTGKRTSALFIPYAYQTGIHYIQIQAEAPYPKKLEIGIIKAGFKNSYRAPKMGMSEGLKEYAVKKEFNNGSQYYKKLSIVRTARLTFPVVQNREAYDFFEMVKDVGSTPIPVQYGVLPDQLLYARMEMPSNTLDNPYRSNMDLNIEEVI